MEALRRVPLEGENTGEGGYYRYQSVWRKKTANFFQRQPLTKNFPDLLPTKGRKECGEGKLHKT